MAGPIGTKGRVLVTGGGGFIGRHAIDPLRDRGFEVIAPSSQEVDLLEPGAAERLVAEVAPSHLLHLAWAVSDGGYWTAEVNRDWLARTEQLLAAFRASGGERAVTAGTCAEYDWTAPSPFVETITPERPSSLYGACKLAVSRLSDAHGRIFFLFGPGERPERLVSSVVLRLLAGEEAPMSHGRQLRDFLYVADVGTAFAQILDSDIEGPINIGSGQAIALADLGSAIADAVGRPDLLRVGALPARPGDPQSIVADRMRLESTGWIQRWELADAVAATVDAWRSRLLASP